MIAAIIAATSRIITVTSQHPFLTNPQLKLRQTAEHPQEKERFSPLFYYILFTLFVLQLCKGGKRLFKVANSNNIYFIATFF